MKLVNAKIKTSISFCEFFCNLQFSIFMDIYGLKTVAHISSSLLKGVDIHCTWPKHVDVFEISGFFSHFL